MYHSRRLNILLLKYGPNLFIFCLLTDFSDLWSDKKRNTKSNILFLNLDLSHIQFISVNVCKLVRI